MHTKRELDERLKEAGVRPLKQLGQNFLVNPDIGRRLVQAVVEARPASVVEIGPGMGALTDDLLSHDWRLRLVELDSGFAEYWRKKAPSAEVVHQDALKVKWGDLDLPGPRALVSNLPYSIAASLVVELSLQEPPPFDFMVLMFQKEVAERIQAGVTGEDYGMLSVVAQALWDVKKLVDAGPQDFFPVPNVGSRVLTFRPKTAHWDRGAFVRLVKAGFAQRRKKLATNLAAVAPAGAAERALAGLGFGTTVRAQELNPQQWVSLFEQTKT